MKDFDIREIEFEEDDLSVEDDFEDIEDELHNLCFTVDEEGNEIPYFCQLSDIEMIYNLDEDEIIDIAYENGYKVYSVFNTDTEEETLVIAEEGFGADEIKSVYEEMFEDEAFEVNEIAQEDEEDTSVEEADESLKEDKNLTINDVKEGQTFKVLKDVFYCDINEEGMFEDDEELVKEFVDNGFKLEDTSLIIPKDTILKFNVSLSIDSYEIVDTEYSFDVGEWSEESLNTPIEIISNESLKESKAKKTTHKNINEVIKEILK